MNETVQPPGTAVRRAVAWISGKRKEHSPHTTSQLVDEAGLLFDLSPREQLSLLRLLTLPGNEPARAEPDSRETIEEG